jgi:hypothetical protein
MARTNAYSWQPGSLPLAGRNACPPASGEVVQPALQQGAEIGVAVDLLGALQATLEAGSDRLPVGRAVLDHLPGPLLRGRIVRLGEFDKAAE